MDAEARPKTIKEIVMDAFVSSMRRHSYNRSHVARELGVSVRTVRNWIVDARALGFTDIETHVNRVQGLKADRAQRILRERRDARLERERIRAEHRAQRRDYRDPSKTYCSRCARPATSLIVRAPRAQGDRAQPLPATQLCRPCAGIRT